ncbi:hypothetical protein ACLM5J_17340 [Nocardioides sp. Bht2]|uniref:hypothetical protein n=1 Tax=Nocardioides sp. Bht2 TaxID=3392297 RepID=UPI0039B5304A
MKLPLRTLAVLAASTALIVGAQAVPTQASSPGKIAVGGLDTNGTNAASGTNVGDLTFASDAAVPMKCTSSTITGAVNRGTSVVASATIGTISDLDFTGCEATALDYPVTVASKGTWAIKVRNTPAPTANIVDIEIANLTAQVKSTGATPLACDFEATGTVPGTFNASTQQITIASTAFPLALQAFDGTGTKTAAATTCGGDVWTGDRANMNGVFNLAVTGGALTF